MPITDWPAADRPREKLLQLGPGALTDAELLAIFLRTGLPGVSAVDLARNLLTEFGSLRTLLTTDLRRFCDYPGLGPAKFAQLQAVMEMARRHLGETLKRSITLTDPGVTKQYLHAQLRDRPHEVFAALFLDNRHRVICFEELFTGTLNGASVHPREVVKRALQHNAAALILAHNHPSGIAEPSQADRQLTARLKDALALVEIRVLDHIIVGDSTCYAFAEAGLI